MGREECRDNGMGALGFGDHVVKEQKGQGGKGKDDNDCNVLHQTGPSEVYRFFKVAVG
jgi:hypothetical protein